MTATQEKLFEEVKQGLKRLAPIRASGSLMLKVKAALASGFEPAVIAATFGISENLVKQVQELKHDL